MLATVQKGLQRPVLPAIARGVRSGAVLMLVTFGFGALPTSLRAAQPATPPRGGFDVKVVDVTSQSRQVSVPLERSAIVETSVEVSRADVVSSDLVDVQAVSPTELLLTGKRYGRTNVVLWDKDEKRYVLEVTVEVDLSELSDALKKIDPLGDVEAKSIFGNIILLGTVSSAERAKRMEELANLYLPRLGGEGAQPAVQNHLEVAGEHQVLLRCTVAEVNRRAVRELGINGFLAGDDFKDAFLVNQVGGINPSNIGAAADFPVTGTIPFLTGTDGIPLADSTTLSLGFPRVQMQLFIKAMAENSLASVLAEPNLVATSGETATFLAGGEFPIPVPQGIDQVTIQFREFGVRLNFTPVVRSHQRIRLRVAPEVSELDFSSAVQFQGFVVPGLTARSAETTVEMGSGQTLAIAGLLNEQVRGLANRVPGIGDLPVLGALFRSVNFQRSLTELVILVTPEIVAPLEANQTVPLPTDSVKSPSDFDLYMLGLVEQRERAECTGPECEDMPDESTAAILSQRDELLVHGPWGYAGAAELR
ncbi:MAG: type II and III secretion system protein family protein [Phycisphaerae bacterium]|nr:type II and III secretion system protein family protein [Phycisphaerae bacterium]